MAEALAVVGVVASIVQLVDFSTRVVSRLDEFYSVTKEVPKSFRDIKTELPLLATTLEQLKVAIDSTSIADGSKKALIPVITGCNEQVAQLDAILEKTLPKTKDSWRTKGKKAIVSLHHDTKVESITRTLRNYIGILTFYNAAASSTLQPLTDAKLCKIYQWLSAPDPSTNYQNALKLRQADTGLWFLESDVYSRWKISASSPLWLYRIPRYDDPRKIIIYFFFDFNEVQKQDPEMMSIKIPASLDALFSLSENGQRQLSLYSLLEVLKSIIQELPQVYILLDALDESAQRVELMEMLKAIAGWQLQNLHLLVTSRKERDIKSSLDSIVGSGNQICLESALVDKDIQRYIQQRLSTDESLYKWKKDNIVRQEIEAKLKEGAHGMFRWAVCQLNILGKCRNRVMLRKALTTLPPTLDQTYDRILSAISEEDSEYALRILRWLTFSARPLSIDEVAEVVAIDVKRDPAFDRNEVLEDPLEVLNICSSLVTIAVDSNYRSAESSKQVVTLAHYSVKEYLVSDRILTGKAAKYGMRDDISQEVLATGCVGYILQLQRSELEPDFLKHFKLARYSAEFWTKHAQKTGERMEAISREAIRLCSKENFAYVNWIRLWNPDKPLQEPDLKRNPKEIPNPLYYMSLVDMRDAVKILLDKGAKPNAQRGRYGNALQAASYRGHEVVVRMLLEKGANPNAKGGIYGNALQAASEEGHKAVAQLLLDKGADPNARGGYYSDDYAIYGASYGGHETVVKVLLDKGANPNAKGGAYGNALQASSERGYERVVKVLLDKGADPNAKGGYYGKDNALCAASNKGHEAVVKLLLDKGADPNAKGGDDGRDSALYVASIQGYNAVVKLLLDKGADIGVANKNGWTPLYTASYKGHVEVVKLLLDKGADTGVANEDGWTPLCVASYEGRVEVVKLLLDKGADTGVANEDGWTPLYTASTKGHVEVVKLLLDKGADIGVANEDGWTPLCTASKEGHVEVVKLLLDKDADPNAQDGEYGNALQAASSGGHEAVVKLLLDKGADTAARDIHGWTASMAAFQNGHRHIVDILGGRLCDQQPSWEECLAPSLLTVLGNSTVEITGNGTVATSDQLSVKELKSRIQLRAEHPFPIAQRLRYFEVTIHRVGHNRIFGVGFCHENSPHTGMPGWKKGSWAYHGDDGKLYMERGQGVQYGDTYGTGDVICCGSDINKDELFFTKNGTRIGSAGTSPSGRIFAVVGVGCEDFHFSINFGPGGFRCIL